jgi:FixJ family two-component response regulator
MVMTESVPGTVETPVVVVLNRDLMFGSRIRSAMATLGLQAVVKGDTGAFLETARELGDRAVLAIIDMNGKVDWEAIATALREDETLPPVLGFGSHTDVETRRAAKAAGVDRIVSNGQFHADMAGYVQRYRRS